MWPAPGKFSSDRTIAEYAAEIWNAEAVPGALELRHGSKQGSTHGDLPTRRQAGPEGDAGRPGPARARVLRAPARPGRSRPSWSASAPAATAARRCTARSPRRTSWPSPRPSATTGAARAPTARSTWARTRTRCPGPAQRTALEVLAANGVETVIQRDDGVTPTPVISRAILVYNRGRTEHLADGIVITPSHNPPEDGGFKYNPPNGGPADTDVTRVDPGPGQRAAARRQRRREARAVRRGPQGGDHAPGRLRPALRRRPAQRHRHGRHPRRRPQARRRPARRRRRALLGADQRASTGWTSRSSTRRSTRPSRS